MLLSAVHLPNNALSVPEDSNNVSILLPDNELATEIKVGILTAQSVSNNVRPMKVIGARPQTTNERCDAFNDSLIKSVQNAGGILVSVAFDGLSAETVFIRDYFLNFLKGRTQTVGIVDPNHVGSGICCIGNSCFDVGLLQMAGVASNLYRVDDFASDAVVLELASAKSIDKVIQRCQDSDRDSLNATILSLLFLRMFIVVSSGTDFPRAQGITVLWTCLLFFTSMRMSVVTKRNFVGAVLPIICLYAQRKVKKMGRTTSEPAEHFFGGCRMRKREFTCRDFLNMVDALEVSLQKVVEH